jgi:hypothetical protein
MRGKGAGHTAGVIDFLGRNEGKRRKVAVHAAGVIDFLGKNNAKRIKTEHLLGVSSLCICKTFTDIQTPTETNVSGFHGICEVIQSVPPILDTVITCS